MLNLKLSCRFDLYYELNQFYTDIYRSFVSGVTFGFHSSFSCFVVRVSIWHHSQDADSWLSVMKICNIYHVGTLDWKAKKSFFFSCSLYVLALSQFVRYKLQNNCITKTDRLSKSSPTCGLLFIRESWDALLF